MLPEAQGFAHSGLLGRRAEHVYAWFLKSLHLPGDVAECGVFHGETSRELVRYLEGHGSPKTVHLFDTFAGLPDAISAGERSLSTGEELAVGRYACSVETVRARLRTVRQYRLHVGLFADTFAAFAQPLCFIHADADLYQSTVDIIRLADRCLVRGGQIVFDDYANRNYSGGRAGIGG